MNIFIVLSSPVNGIYAHEMSDAAISLIKTVVLEDIDRKNRTT